jgi:hypothetical protein
MFGPYGSRKPLGPYVSKPLGPEDLENLYGSPVKYISKGKLFNEITDKMGNKYAFYNDIQDNILRLYGQPGDTTDEVYDSLVRQYATEYITNWLRSKRMYDHSHLRMVKQVVNDFMEYNRANPRGEVEPAPHLTMPDIPPHIEYEPEAPKKTVFKAVTRIPGILATDFKQLADKLARKKNTDEDEAEYYNTILGGKSKKSKKQQRKTKARKTHQKRTQRK